MRTAGSRASDPIRLRSATGSRVDQRRIKDALGYRLISIAGEQAAIVATAVALVAGCPSMLDDANQHAVLFAIHKNGAYLLDVARLLAFAPDGITGTAEEVRIARFTCQSQRLLVHKGHHQHLAAGIILDHGGYQALAIKFQHGRTSTPFACKYCFTSRIRNSPK